MLVYQCKSCGKLLIGGVANEYNEHFCNEKCYKKYCETNNYEVHTEKLKTIKTALD